MFTCIKCKSEHYQDSAFCSLCRQWFVRLIKEAIQECKREGLWKGVNWL